MPLVESASLAVLADKLNVVALVVESGEGESLRSRPVNFAVLKVRQPIGDMHLFESGMNRKILRQFNRLLDHLFQLLNVGKASIIWLLTTLGRDDAGPLVSVSTRAFVLLTRGIFQVRIVALTFLVFAVEVNLDFIPQLFDVRVA
jgi:hypothetical protein